MLFTVGVELPENENTAYGLAVPALFTGEYSCFSFADSEAEIVQQVQDAVLTIVEEMAANGVDLAALEDKGFRHYREQEDFAFYDTWLLVDVDISAFIGKKQRVNISIPDYVLRRIDQTVAGNPHYKDRSHFLTVAAEHEMAQRP